MTALAQPVYVDGVLYPPGTDHTAMPGAAVDRIRNPSAWVGGVAPALSNPETPPGKARIPISDLANAATARAALGIPPSVAWSSPGITIPPGWGSVWQTKLAAAKAGAGLARVALIGSSTTQGYYSSNLRTTSMASLLRTGLQAYAGDGGSGYEGMQFSDTFLSGAPSAVYAAYQANSNAWTQTGTWTTPTWWRGPSMGYLAGTSGATVTIPFRGTALDIWWFNVHSAAAWTYAIDGGDPVTVTPGAGMGADLAVTTTTATGLSAGAHTVVITSGTGLRLAGVTGRNATGVRVDNFGIAGMQSAAFNNGDSFNSATYAGGWRNPADLVIIQGPSNDIIKATQTYTNVATNTNTTINSTSLRLADVGRSISGPGIPTGTTIVSVNDSAGTAVISQAATATATDQTMTITDPDPAGRWASNVQRYLSGVLDNWYGGGSTPDGSVDVVFFWPLFPTNSANDPQLVYKRLQAVGRSLAESYGAATVDIGAIYRQSWSRWYNEGKAGNTANPATSGNDAVHAANAGHAFYADTLLKLLRRVV